MSRLIDADALKYKAREIIPNYHASVVMNLFDLIDNLADNMPTIEALQGRKAGEWIPVSERLPEIGEHYVSEPCIVYCSNGAYGFAELEENIFGQVVWNCERDDEYHEPLGEVLAWMPLPEPWRGE